MNKTKLLAAASASALLVVGFGATGADAAKKWITGADVKNGSLTGADIKNNSLTGADIKNGSVKKADLSPWVQDRLAQKAKDGKDGKDASFDLTQHEFDKVTIANIGGKFADRATPVGEITLQPGTYLVQTDAKFTANSKPDAAPSLMAAVRILDANNVILGEAGTAFATFPDGAIRNGLDVQGSSVKLIELDQERKLTVSAFGYNADTSTAGSGKFDALVSVVVQKVG